MKMGKFEKFFINRPSHAEQVIGRAEKLLALVDVKEEENCLDVGCGNGALSKYVAETCQLRVTGVDVDPEQVQLARDNVGDVPGICFREADATNLPFQDNDFALVLSFGLMHHIFNWSNALEEINRVLRPEGYFVYFDLVYPGWAARMGSSKPASSVARNYGFPTVQGISSFVDRNDFLTLHSSLSMRYLLLFNHYEAVYQKRGVGH